MLNLIFPFLIREDPQRMNELYYNSAYLRAVCIADGVCNWSHDGWKEHFRENIGNYTYAAENLAKDFENWDQVYIAWENSPKHKEVLDKKYCYEGKAQYKNVFVLHRGCP